MTVSLKISKFHHASLASQNCAVVSEYDFPADMSFVSVDDRAVFKARFANAGEVASGGILLNQMQRDYLGKWPGSAVSASCFNPRTDLPNPGVEVAVIHVRIAASAGLVSTDEIGRLARKALVDTPVASRLGVALGENMVAKVLTLEWTAERNMASSLKFKDFGVFGSCSEVRVMIGSLEESIKV